MRTARTQFDLVTGAEARRMLPAAHERVPGVATGDTYGDRLAARHALDYECEHGVRFDRMPDGTITIRRTPEGAIWRDEDGAAARSAGVPARTPRSAKRSVRGR